MRHTHIYIYLHERIFFAHNTTLLRKCPRGRGCRSKGPMKSLYILSEALVPFRPRSTTKVQVPSISKCISFVVVIVCFTISLQFSIKQGWLAQPSSPTALSLFDPTSARRSCRAKHTCWTGQDYVWTAVSLHWLKLCLSLLVADQSALKGAWFVPRYVYKKKSMHDIRHDFMLQQGCSKIALPVALASNNANLAKILPVEMLELIGSHIDTLPSVNIFHRVMALRNNGRPCTRAQLRKFASIMSMMSQRIVEGNMYQMPMIQPDYDMNNYIPHQSNALL